MKIASLILSTLCLFLIDSSQLRQEKLLCIEYICNSNGCPEKPFYFKNRCISENAILETCSFKGRCQLINGECQVANLKELKDNCNPVKEREAAKKEMELAKTTNTTNKN